MDNLIYGFMGTDAWNLAAVHLLPSAFKISAQYNVLNDSAVIQMGLDGLPQDQSFHPYVLATMAGMTNSACQHAIMLPTEWYQELAEHFPHGVNLKTFYDHFLATMAAGDARLSMGCSPDGDMQHQGLPALQHCAQDYRWSLNRPCHQ